MPKAYPVNVALTQRQAITSRANLRPTPAMIQAEHPDPSDQEELLDAMAETLLYGCHKACNKQTLDLTLRQDFPKLYQPNPGRCLYTWDTLIKLADRLSLPRPSIQAIMGVSLRPSATQEHLLGTTPMAALTSTGGYQSHMQRIAEMAGLRQPKTSRMAEYFKFQDFGSQNERYFQLDGQDLEWRAPKNSKRSTSHHYAIQMDETTLPLQEILLRWPPVHQVLSYQLNRNWEDARRHLLSLDKTPSTPHARYTLRLAKQHKTIPVDVARLVLGCAGYNGPIPWHRLYDPNIEPKEHATLMLARQVLQQRWNKHTCDGLIALATSLLSGVSPAIFAKTSIDMLNRLGISFLSEGEIMRMVSYIEMLPEPRATRQREERQDLIDELEDLAVEFGQSRDLQSASLQEEVYTITTEPGSIPAWGVV